MLLGETESAAPREVRIAEDHPGAGGGRVLADRGRVGSDRQVVAQLRHVRCPLGDQTENGIGDQGGQAKIVECGRVRVDDLLQEVAGRRDDVRQVDAVPEVQFGGVRLDVRRALALRVGDVVCPADVLEPLVHAGGVAGDHLACLRAGPVVAVGQQLLHDLTIVQIGHQCVDLEVRPVHGDLVVVLVVGSQVLRPLPARSQDGVGERADRRLGSGIAGAEPERTPVLGNDVRDVVLRAGDRGSIRRCIGGGRRETDESGGDDRGTRRENDATQRMRDDHFARLLRSNPIRRRIGKVCHGAIRRSRARASLRISGRLQNAHRTRGRPASTSS